MLNFFIALLLAIPVVALLSFLLLLNDHFKKQAHKRKIETHHALHRFNPDANGNYPAYFDPRSGTYFAPPAGNSAHPAQIIMYNGQKQAVKDERVIAINPPRPVQVDEPPARDLHESPGTAVQVDEMLPALDAPIDERKLKVGELFSPERDINANRELLRTLKKEGRGQEEAIFAVLNLRSRSGALYKTYAQFWKEMEV